MRESMGDANSGGSVGGDDVYKGRVEPNLYT